MEFNNLEKSQIKMLCRRLGLTVKSTKAACITILNEELQKGTINIAIIGLILVNSINKNSEVITRIEKDKHLPTITFIT